MGRKATKKLNHRVAVTASKRGVTVVDQHIGTRLRARRLELHISQEEVARKLGLSFQQIQKYEKGVNRIGSSRLVDIAHILDVDTSYFLMNLKGNDGGNGKATTSHFVEFLATTDGVAINEAMMKLDEPHRRSIIDLARILVRAYAT